MIRLGTASFARTRARSASRGRRAPWPTSIAQVEDIGHTRTSTHRKTAGRAAAPEQLKFDRRGPFTSRDERGGARRAARSLTSPHRQRRPRRSCLTTMGRAPRRGTAGRCGCRGIDRLQIGAQGRRGVVAAGVVLLQEQIERQAKAPLGEPTCRAMTGGAAVRKQPRTGFAGIEIFRPCTADDNQQQHGRSNKPQPRSGAPARVDALRRHQPAGFPRPAHPAHRDRPAPDRRASARSAAVRRHGRASASGPGAR